VSSTTWTPSAVGSETFHVRRLLWRAVESQHKVSTLPLVDALAEQDALERLLEKSKPVVPQPARRLHWLLFTPFRYHPLRTGSRFRSVTDPGVFYGADERRTACAELGYWRWRFLMDSPALQAIDARPQTVFSARIDARAIDLTREPFVRDRAWWSAPADYHACQQLAAVAREARVGAVRYASVRDPLHGMCTGVLTPDAFSEAAPREQQSWLLSLTRAKAFWRRDSVLHQEAFEFDAAPWRAAL
jgi:hypothetical protein